MVFPFLKLLPGTGRFRVLGAWWARDGGRSGCGSSSFCRFVIAFISFIFGHVCVVAPAFSFGSNSCIGVVAILI